MTDTSAVSEERLRELRTFPELMTSEVAISLIDEALAARARIAVLLQDNEHHVARAYAAEAQLRAAKCDYGTCDYALDSDGRKVCVNCGNAPAQPRLTDKEREACERGANRCMQSANENRKLSEECATLWMRPQFAKAGKADEKACYLLRALSQGDSRG